MERPLYKKYKYLDKKEDVWYNDAAYVEDLEKYCDSLETTCEVEHHQCVVAKEKSEYWRKEAQKAREMIDEIITIKNRYYDVIDKLCLKLEELGVRTTPIGTVATKKDWKDWGFENE